MGDHQAPPFRFFLEFLVVVASTPAAILHTVSEIIQVYGFMRDSGHHFLYGPLQRLCAYVQLVPLFSLALPNLGYRNVPIGPWGALYGDDWLLQLPAKPIRIDCPENLLQVPCCS